MRSRPSGAESNKRAPSVGGISRKESASPQTSRAGRGPWLDEMGLVYAAELDRRREPTLDVELEARGARKRARTGYPAAARTGSDASSRLFPLHLRLR